MLRIKIMKLFARCLSIYNTNLLIGQLIRKKARYNKTETIIYLKSCIEILDKETEI